LRIVDPHQLREKLPMAIAFDCPNCGQTLRCNEKKIGKTADCPGCGEPVTVPKRNESKGITTPASGGSIQPASNETVEQDSDANLLDREDEIEDYGSEMEVPRQASYFVDLLVFRRMITPVVVQVLFWIGVVVSWVFGIIGFVTGIYLIFQDQAVAGLLGMVFALVYLIAIPLAMRIYAETIILFFRMNETLTDIRDRVG